LGTTCPFERLAPWELLVQLKGVPLENYLSSWKACPLGTTCPVERRAPLETTRSVERRDPLGITSPVERCVPMKTTCPVERCAPTKLLAQSKSEPPWEPLVQSAAPVGTAWPNRTVCSIEGTLCIHLWFVLEIGPCPFNTWSGRKVHPGTGY
jgi:hypothetical protein